MRSSLRQIDVVTCFLIRQGQLLLLLRSDQVGSHVGLWAGVSGYIEEDTPMEQAFLEVEQETGLGPRDVHLLHRGKPLDAPDEESKRLWRVHPFLFEVEPGREIRLDWEHSDCRWVAPEAIGTMDTVPLLAEAWGRVAAGFKTA